MISYQKKPDWTTLLLLAGMYLLLAANLYLYTAHRLPILLHILISACAIHLAFTIWHDAAHGTTAKNQWANNLIGIFGIFPYSTPYFIQRHIHLLHHTYLNQKNDPNYIYTDGPFWQIPFRYVRAIGFMKNLISKDNDPRKPFELWIDRAMTAAVAGIYLLALVTGKLLDLVILWTIPLAIAKITMDWYINYIPHVGLPAHKYKGTRILDIPWLTPLILSHNYHAVHHLWPQQPWHAYTKIFRDTKAELIANGVPVQTTFKFDHAQ